MYYVLRKGDKMKNRIRELRKDLGLSQDKFGDMVGVTRSHIASMENGKALASKRVIDDIAEACKVNPEWIEFGTGPKDKTPTQQEELAYLMGACLADGDAFKTKIIKAMLTLEDEDWKFIERLIEKMTK